MPYLTSYRKRHYDSRWFRSDCLHLYYIYLKARMQLYQQIIYSRFLKISPTSSNSSYECSSGSISSHASMSHDTRIVDRWSHVRCISTMAGSMSQLCTLVLFTCWSEVWSPSSRSSTVRIKSQTNSRSPSKRIWENNKSTHDLLTQIRQTIYLLYPFSSAYLRALA